ncbi:hypothetical protein UFOVP573_92 [uncultured Caudovirales phage]|jgi:hypothetical protein|uniref:Uncharacterized protein n=1 Tax=uncultured Caudovirales phage TaxID=2100421 RepID=A0A6J7XRX3_9CAUD|nr:hypothetical protein UFOVP288_23 [uncultured Caudovirales phage]CAB4146054.1 hypothetical protein UFOVP483_16 [uncultured Caudovirales phage]CAB4150978.1 hypothetical protein UFOVP573_92 [uncultured Caudovirales phage]CAB4160932.1 hypothetical protein UFOVP769_23 [uncultured Caudovirales phage]CAB4175315.1 hypothetical protein UFOVP962_148 [uncultured Caudovirales phage]
MNKDELTTYIYNNMSQYRPSNTTLATKHAESFWRVFETKLVSNDTDIVDLLDTFIENTFKRQ